MRDLHFSVQKLMQRSATIDKLHSELKIKDEFIQQLKADNNKLAKQVSDLTKSSDDLEQY